MKNDSTTICCVQISASKNTQYSKNEKFLKIHNFGHSAWAIAFGKCSV